MVGDKASTPSYKPLQGRHDHTSQRANRQAITVSVQADLEFLDSYEEQWAVRESLSDRQIAWLEKQLSWTNFHQLSGTTLCRIKSQSP